MLHRSKTGGTITIQMSLKIKIIRELICEALWDTVYPTNNPQRLSKLGRRMGTAVAADFCAKSQRLLAAAVFSTADGYSLRYKILQVQEKSPIFCHSSFQQIP